MRFLLAALFFFSGCASLIFETLCSRKLALVLGSTVQSASATVSAFLLGLGLGAYLAGRFIARAHRPVLVFAALEACAGMGALVVLSVIPYLSNFLVPVARDYPALLQPLRLLLVFGLLLLPALAMGASLPILSQHFVHTLGQDFVRALGALYAVNTLGAVSGVLVTDFFLVERIGVARTGWISCLLYLGVAMLALSLARSEGSELEDEERELPPPAPVAVVVLAASGFCGLTFQVLWTRMMAFFNGSDVFAFSTTLAVYLLGLVIGSALISWQGHRIEKPTKFLGYCLMALSLTGYLSLFTVGGVRWFRGLLGGFGLGASLQSFLACALVMLLPVVTLGLVFPLASELLQQGAEGAGRAVGKAYLWNTLGSVTGALLAGFVLLPRLGLQGSLGLSAGLSLAVGYYVLRREQARGPAVVGVLLFALALLMTPADTLMRAFYPETHQDIVFKGDDHYGSVVFTRSFDPFGNPVENLLVDGFNMAGNTISAKRYATGLAVIPLMLHPDPKDVLVVCMGMGNTLNSALQLSPTEHVDCVELSSKVVAALRYTSHGPAALDSQKLRLILGDGRNHLLTTEHSYDVISAEPPPPTHAGIVNLYSREYYQLCDQRLKPGGLAVQWLPVMAMSRLDAQTIIRAFQDVFPYTYLWQSAGLQLCLIGSKEPLDLDYERLKERVIENREFLRLTGWHQPELFPALFLAGPEELRGYVADVPPVTDDWPHLQYSRDAWVADIEFFFLRPEQRPLDWRAGEADQQRLSRAYRAVLAGRVVFYLAQRNPQFSKLEEFDLGGLLMATFPEDPFYQNRLAATDPYVSQLQNQPEPEARFELARVHFLNNRFPQALKALDGLEHDPMHRLFKVLVLYRGGDHERARELFEKVRDSGASPDLQKEVDYLVKVLQG